MPKLCGVSTYGWRLEMDNECDEVCNPSLIVWCGVVVRGWTCVMVKNWIMYQCVSCVAFVGRPAARRLVLVDSYDTISIVSALARLASLTRGGWFRIDFQSSHFLLSLFHKEIPEMLFLSRDTYLATKIFASFISVGLASGFPFSKIVSYWILFFVASWAANNYKWYWH